MNKEAMTDFGKRGLALVLVASMVGMGCAYKTGEGSEGEEHFVTPDESDLVGDGEPAGDLGTDGDTEVTVDDTVDGDDSLGGEVCEECTDAVCLACELEMATFAVEQSNPIITWIAGRIICRRVIIGLAGAAALALATAIATAVWQHFQNDFRGWGIVSDGMGGFIGYALHKDGKYYRAHFNDKGERTTEWTEVAAPPADVPIQRYCRPMR